jgi:hypothetical protein
MAIAQRSAPPRRRIATPLCVALLVCALGAACGRQTTAAATTDAATKTAVAAPAAAKARAPLAPIQPGIPLDLSYVDRGSPAFDRFRRWVDQAAAGQPGYAFSAYDAALLYRLEPKKKYCDLAVATVEREVAAGEAAIADGRAPEIAGDSYLEVGPRIAALAMTLDTCKAQIDEAQRKRWSAFAEQAVWNVWNHLRAHWGMRPRPWTGWSVDNPGNNYYYSFVEATLYWALASGSNDWMRFLNEEKIPPLIAYFAKLPGGGSLEGTGYGAAHMRLFALYRLWRDATGEDIAGASPHARDTIAYWVHATVPTVDRFAPIGDQSRNSVPELYDYHRRLVLEARALSRDPDAQALAAWWLQRIAIDRMSNGFNTQYDLLPAGEGKAAPQALLHHAPGTGHLFARTGWDRDAMWLAFVAGPYNESHAHQDQGSFTLFARDWLAVTENIWTRSGIQQGTEVHNVLRFERAAPIARQCQAPRDDRIVHQCQPTTSTMTVQPGDAAGAVRVEADLTAAYGRESPVRRWTRRLDFAGRRLRVEDRFAVEPGTAAVFQLQVPVEPRIDGATAVAGRLQIRVLEPAGAVLRVHDWRSVDDSEFRGGWRLDISGGTDTYVVELTERSN